MRRGVGNMAGPGLAVIPAGHARTAGQGRVEVAVVVAEVDPAPTADRERARERGPDRGHGPAHDRTLALSDRAPTRPQRRPRHDSAVDEDVARVTAVTRDRARGQNQERSQRSAASQSQDRARDRGQRARSRNRGQDQGRVPDRGLDRGQNRERDLDRRQSRDRGVAADRDRDPGRPDLEVDPIARGPRVWKTNHQQYQGNFYFLFFFFFLCKKFFHHLFAYFSRYYGRRGKSSSLELELSDNEEKNAQPVPKTSTTVNSNL